MAKPLPPFSGDDTQCPKCSNLGAYTEWKEAEMLGPSYLQRERLRRRCARCDYEWDEALNPPAEQPARTTPNSPCPACRRADQAGLSPDEQHPHCHTPATADGHLRPDGRIKNTASARPGPKEQR